MMNNPKPVSQFSISNQYKINNTMGIINSVLSEIDPSDKDDWEKYFINDIEKKIDRYSSIIPSDIVFRASEVLDHAALLRVERIDLPRLPSGKPSEWWYFVQFKTCTSCIFLTVSDPSMKNKVCQHPKINKTEFAKHFENQKLCPYWNASFDANRLQQEKTRGFSENLFVWAAFVKLGISSNPVSVTLPAIGEVESFSCSSEIANAADYHNSLVYYYLQLYYLKQSGYIVNEKKFPHLTLDYLPTIKAQKYDTSSIKVKKDDGNAKQIS
jgi:hypothetical protein